MLYHKSEIKYGRKILQNIEHNLFIYLYKNQKLNIIIYIYINEVIQFFLHCSNVALQN